MGPFHSRHGFGGKRLYTVSHLGGLSFSSLLLFLFLLILPVLLLPARLPLSPLLSPSPSPLIPQAAFELTW